MFAHSSHLVYDAPWRHKGGQTGSKCHTPAGIDSLSIRRLRSYYVDSNASPLLLDFPLPYTLFKTSVVIQSYTLYSPPLSKINCFIPPCHSAALFTIAPLCYPAPHPIRVLSEELHVHWVVPGPLTESRLEVVPENLQEEIMHRYPPDN